MGIVIKGVGYGIPERIVTNHDLEKLGDTSDEWIRERTGISQRRIASGEETGGTLSYTASVQAIKSAQIEPADIDLIIVATIAPDMLIPSAACALKKQLGAEKAIAFDINVACSGFIYAVWIAKSLMETGGYKNALVLGCELLSKITDWSDRGTFVLFGDGVGAAILQQSDEHKGIIAHNLKNTDDETGALTLCGMDIENPFNTFKPTFKKVSMDGKQVFKFATAAMVDNIKVLLEKSCKTIEDITWVVPHQANKRIIDFAAAKFKTSIEKFYCNIDKFGNTSAASVPIALAEMNEKGLLKRGDLIILVAFGGGLTSGALLVEW